MDNTSKELNWIVIKIFLITWRRIEKWFCCKNHKIDLDKFECLSILFSLTNTITNSY